MVHQVLFTLKDKTKNKLKCHMLQFLFGALSVKTGFFICGIYKNYIYICLGKLYQFYPCINAKVSYDR